MVSVAANWYVNTATEVGLVGKYSCTYSVLTTVVNLFELHGTLESGVNG